MEFRSDGLDRLAAIASSGNVNAINDAIQSIHGQVSAIVRQSRIHPSDFDDAVQESLLVVLECITRYPSVCGSFRSYVYVSVRKMLSRRRFRFNYASIPDMIGDDGEMSNVVLADCLAVLDSDHREVVREYYGIGVQDKTINQIAASRGLGAQTVRRMIDEALERMRG